MSSNDSKPAVKRESKVKKEIKDESGDEVDIKPTVKKAAVKTNRFNREAA